MSSLRVLAGLRGRLPRWARLARSASAAGCACLAVAVTAAPTAADARPVTAAADAPAAGADSTAGTDSAASRPTAAAERVAPGGASPAGVDPQSGSAPSAGVDTPSGAPSPPAARVGVEWAGALGVAFWPEPFALALTCGGPRATLMAGEWRFSLGFFPSLVYGAAWATAPLRPSLGAGGEVSYGHATVFAAAYLIADVLRPLVGVGYRF